MRIVNKLTKPGGIRRVDLMLDIVRIQTSDGQDRVYRLVPDYTAKEEVVRNEDDLPTRS